MYTIYLAMGIEWVFVANDTRPAERKTKTKQCKVKLTKKKNSTTTAVRPDLDENDFTVSD